MWSSNKIHAWIFAFSIRVISPILIKFTTYVLGQCQLKFSHFNSPISGPCRDSLSRCCRARRLSRAELDVWSKTGAKLCYILVTAIGGRPKPELCFLPGGWGERSALRQFTQWLWIEHPTFQLGGGHFTRGVTMGGTIPRAPNHYGGAER